MTEKILSVADLAEMVEGQVLGDATVLIGGFAPLDTAGPKEISFLAKAKMASLLATTSAGAVLVPPGVEAVGSLPVIRVKDPYLAVAIIHSFFVAVPFVAKGIHPRAFVGENCLLGKEISIAPLAVLGDRVKTGERVSIEAGAVIGDDVELGDDTTIKANVTIYDGCKIGKRVTIHSGTVIGSDGFGYSANERGEHIKRPQIGTVRIDDDVEIGANTCVDRAAYGVTWIKSGVKIDNLVQVAHNVILGENSLLVAQVGLSGSTTLGRNVVMGGQAASSGHLTLGDQVMVAARGAVHGDQPKGAVVGGTPAIPVRQWAKACAVFAKLPELQSTVRKNSKAIAELCNMPDRKKENI
ncbi:UDP-3-O-(3-hydroxymyristoyl)glucosamine N-acyltransferase [Desulfopila sp. IMCC35006]|uniref:UDP-3-O-(3-hydroxymyristoyl)glucosamine N-acyltransferase n=1 Tax=Desulfopila sp. IMCC35006 TaxID=2569542 RepID=UPI0010ABD7D5|nr:UDP-3-O-(3-hydroxymyristoyl)glucosamine N-acyltransferase [Desulfopila sp. IMCC35006]TKB26534.1 UDP-3-O-(3-hydroxymyristoyl)glucosamine N-acyltransferase [Desulfopila sp. IMCC35006]